jgi:aminopeptidase N
MARDSDAFNRWEAGQVLATEILLEMADRASESGVPAADRTYLDAIGDVLARAEDDPAFAALMLVPPLESELAMARTPVDPDAIHAARMALIGAIADAHGSRLQKLYDKFSQTGTFSPDAKAAGERSLRNAALRYLTAAEDGKAAERADKHYRAASNMTDMIAGLAALSRMNSNLRELAFAHFYDRFRQDALVLDKWLALQASSQLPGTVAGVRALMKHPIFDMKNPNRVRALVGTFSGNHLRFHAGNGEGYALVGETVRALDSINPQVAARMAGAFENWRRYNGERQKLMRAEMETIAKMDGLSTNLFEVTSKMLG